MQWDFCCNTQALITTDGCNKITPRVEGGEAPLRPGPGVEVSQPGGGVQGGAPHHARARGRVLDTACTHISIVSTIYPVSFNSSLAVKYLSISLTVIMSPREILLLLSAKQTCKS